MATTTTKPNLNAAPAFPGIGVTAWPGKQDPSLASPPDSQRKPTRSDALQALLAFSALHEQVRRRRALAARSVGFDSVAPLREFEDGEQFILDEVLQLVAERAIAITGADGLAIALAESNQIVLRASAGAVKPDVGARIDRESAFSGACFRLAQIVRCDDTETDDRVNVVACRRLGARSMVAVPLCGRRRVIGLLEAFSVEPFGFNDSDVHSLSLLAELILGALKPEDEDPFAESAQAAEAVLDAVPAARHESAPAVATPQQTPAKIEVPAPPPPVVAKAADAAAAPAPAIAEVEEEDEPLFALAKVAPTAAPEVETRTATVREIAKQGLMSPNHRPLLILIAVVIGVLLAAGAWWKFGNAQLGNAVVQPQKPVLKPVKDEDAISAAAQPAAPASTPGLAAAPTETPTDILSSGASPSNTPATPQELAKFPRVTGIREWSSADSTTVVLDLQDQVQYEAHRLSNPDRIFFDLRDTTLAPELMGKTVEVGDALLHRIRVAQPVPGTTRVVLETRGNSNFSVSLESNPYRLVMQVRKIGANPKGAVNLFPGSEAGRNPLAIVVPPPTREDLQLRARVPKMRIVVDAGHGGWDLGTVGRRGLLEKDVVLEIGQRLGKLLESRLGAEIIYTRQDDNYIPLDERAGIANQAQADLFVSVHANYSDLPSARGVETYYTNFFSSPNAKDLETRANTGGNKNAVTATLTPAELHDRIEQSRRLAASVQRSLYGTLSAQAPGLRDRGVKAAGFVVLTETAMPGILAEVSFVSSPTDEQKLRSDGYREQIAEALYKGIARYAASSRGGVKVASTGK